MPPINDWQDRTIIDVAPPARGESMTKSIVVMGGCHVDGYGVESHVSFSAILEASLRSCPRSIDLRTFPLFRIKNVSEAAEILQATRPDVLVLQLGNYEATPKFRQLSSASSRTPPGPTGVGPPRSPSRFTRTPRWVAVNTARLIAHHVLRLGHVNTESVAKDIEAFFEMVRGRGIPTVVAITPFPYWDSVIHRCRLRVGASMMKSGRARGFIVEDSVPLLAKPELFLADGAHLNPDGHDRLGRRLAELCGARLRA
jgi:hypothetical protein